MREVIDASKLNLEENIININRVTKVVKGGRNFRFNALAVVGDGNGHVGIGTGKALEVPAAIHKAIADAKKNLVKIPLKGSTVPHEVIGRSGSGKVYIMPAPKGTGILAGGPVRSVLELVGLEDVRAKSIGSNNPKNMVDATINGLMKLVTLESVSKLRGVSIDHLLGKDGSDETVVD